MKTKDNKSVKSQHLAAVAIATAVTLPGMAILAEEADQKPVDQNVVEPAPIQDSFEVTTTPYYEEEDKESNVENITENITEVKDLEEYFSHQFEVFDSENQKTESVNSTVIDDSKSDDKTISEEIGDLNIFLIQNKETDILAKQYQKNIEEPISEVKPLNNSVYQFGDGSEENPYQVSTAEQLDAVRNDLSAHYIQTADIDLSGINWKPIGWKETEIISDTAEIYYQYSVEDFNGTFDGDNHKITGINIKLYNPEIKEYGLFAVAGYSATIKNLNLNLNIDLPTVTYDYAYIGGIAGRTESLSSSSQCAKILNCVCNGEIKVNIDYAWSRLMLGGIVGSGSARFCTNNANIKVMGEHSIQDGRNFIGGISGSNLGYSPIMENCINNGNILVQTVTGSYIGGIIGEEFSGLKNCLNTGSITLRLAEHPPFYPGSFSLGGIIGAAYKGGDNLVNIGNLNLQYISCESSKWIKGYICGIIGRREFDSDRNPRYNISNAYNIGMINIPDFTNNKNYNDNNLYGRICSLEGESSSNLYCLNKIKKSTNISECMEGIDGEDLSEFDIVYKINCFLNELNLPSLFRPEHEPSINIKKNYYEGKEYTIEQIYVANTTNIETELNHIHFFNKNINVLDVTLESWKIINIDQGVAKAIFTVKALKGGETSFGLKLGDKIISEVNCKVIPKFTLSDKGVSLETDEKTISITAESPYLTESMANDLVDKMTWSVEESSGIGSQNIQMNTLFKDGRIIISFKISPYFDSSSDSQATVTVKNLNLQDITFNVYQKGFLSAYDQLLMEAVSQYTNPNQFMDEMNRILADESLPEQKRWEKYVEYLSTCGLLNAKEGISWSKDAYEASRQLAYLTNNDLWLYSIYDDFLRNDPKGQAMIALLYANNLIIGGEYKDYIKPTTYLKFETPEIKKYKSLLYKFMEETSQENYQKTAISEYSKLVGALKTITGKEFYDSVLDLYYSSSNQEVFDSLMSNYLNKYLGNTLLDKKTGNYLLDELHDSLSLAGDGIELLKLTSEALNYVTKTSAMSKVYEGYIDFFEAIICGDSQFVPDSLKMAAFQVQYECTELLNGYLVKLGEMATNLLWDTLTDELLDELLKDLTGTLDLGANIANWLSGYADFSNQVAYIQGYAALSNLYTSKIQSTAEAYRKAPSAELAKCFYEEYNYLKLLREKGESAYKKLCYEDSAVVKQVIGALQSTQPWYKERLDMMNENITYAQNAVFMYSDTASTVASRKTYQNKVVVQCPVDIEVYKDGRLLFTIKDGEEMDIENEYGRFASIKRTFEDDYAKVIYLDDPDCYVKVIGVNDGIVTISHSFRTLMNDVATFVSDYNPISEKSYFVYDLSDPNTALKIDYDGDGNIDEITTLYPIAQEVILPNEIKASQDQVVMKKGDSVVIGLDILPFDTTNKEVNWGSMDPSIVEVQKGVLKAIAPGKTKVIITSIDGKVRKEIDVMVESLESKPDEKPIDPVIPEQPNKPVVPENPSDNKSEIPGKLPEQSELVVKPITNDENSSESEVAHLVVRKDAVVKDSIDTKTSPNTGFAINKSNSFIMDVMSIVGLGWIVNKKCKGRR